MDARDRVEDCIREYPNQEHVTMMAKWLEKNENGSWQFTGLVDPTDETVVTPQATSPFCHFRTARGLHILNETNPIRKAEMNS